MKRMMALVLVALMMMMGLNTCFAAEWPEGRSAAQPYSNVREVDLTQTMGYIIPFPRSKLPVNKFCDVLEIYLPREDLETGTGKAHLYEYIDGRGQEIDTIDFADENAVKIRRLSESEMTTMLWGSGMCVEMYLKKSLQFGHSYYVLMDEGCFAAANGTVKSPAISNPEAWTPLLEGDYGIGNLCYIDAVLPVETENTEEVTGQDEGTGEIVSQPDTGDIISFDLLMNDDTAYAVVYSDNASVSFDQVEYTESGTVTGRVIKDDVKWGVLFLTADAQVYDYIDLMR